MVPPGPVTAERDTVETGSSIGVAGLCGVLVCPSPKSHWRLVMVPLDWSVNWTVRGTVPEVGEALNAAVGGTGWSVTVM